MKFSLETARAFDSKRPRRHARSLTYRVIGSADHGLSDEAGQRAYTALLVNWLTEMIFGAREGGLVAQASPRAGAPAQEAAPHAG